MSQDLPWLAGTVQRKLRTAVGKRFSRFVLVAAASVVASQVALTLLLGAAHVSSGTSGVLAAMVGAAVSYVLSRWAWERKGKPNLLKETLPFWAVSVGAWLVLGLATHFASLWANSMGMAYGSTKHVAFVDGAYFLANCVTFVTRFVIFHYVLFVDRGAKSAPVTVASPSGQSAPAADGESGPFAANGAWGTGASDWEIDAGESSSGLRAGSDTGPLPEVGSRR